MFNVSTAAQRPGTISPPIRRSTRSPSPAPCRRAAQGARRCRAGSVKHVTMELGGKSPLIVFDDSQITQRRLGGDERQLSTPRAKSAPTARGSMCMRTSTTPLSAILKSRDRGHGDRRPDGSRDTQVGSLISADHFEKVREYVRLGIEEGALSGELAARKSPSPAARRAVLSRLPFSPPARMTCASAGRRFSVPVMSVMSFRDEEEVIATAPTIRSSASPPGSSRRTLPAPTGLWRSSAPGTCWINNYNLTPVGVPLSVGISSPASGGKTRPSPSIISRS